MKITGELLIGRSYVRGSEGRMRALNPAENVQMEPEFYLGGATEVDQAARLADEAFDSYSHLPPTERAEFLELIASGLDDVGDTLAERASSETGIPLEVLRNEQAKAAEQFRQFARLVRQGRFKQATIDPAMPDRQPRPRMDHRMQKVAIGPVAIFGASNFPISYSVAGGDTASALAAGCPVILKAHPAHPGASELMGRVIQAAVAKSGLHEGVFSLVIGAGNAIGEALVDHPLIKAVTFTGSEGGGMALHRRAQERPDPIPVFAEMTSVNPTYVLPAALAARGPTLVRGLVQWTSAMVGQACLKPAVVIGVEGAGFDALREAMADAFKSIVARTMLTPGICDAYYAGVQRQADHGAARLAEGASKQRPLDGQAVLFEVSATQVLAEPSLTREVFGPEALLVKCASIEELFAVARSFQGQLSSTIQMDDEDLPLARALLPILERRTGRVVVNAYSMPQEVGYATVHGGPFPATSDSRFTSVGMSAIERFLRPVCYQGFPDALLPEALKDQNSLGLWRVVDGELTGPSPA